MEDMAGERKGSFKVKDGFYNDYYISACWGHNYHLSLERKNPIVSEGNGRENGNSAQKRSKE